eukprot:gene7708-3909_t
MRNLFDEHDVEVFAWIEEEIHSNSAIALAAPTETNAFKPGDTAMSVLWELQEQSSKMLALAPGRWFATGRRDFPKSRYFHITGVTPTETARILSDPEVAARLGHLNVIMCDHRGVLIKTGGNSATMLIPSGMPSADIVQSIARSHNLTLLRHFPTSSRDPSVQRVRVLFAPGDAIQTLGRSVPVRSGEHQLVQIK